MILPYLDLDIIFLFINLNTIANLSFLSKYHHQLINDNSFEICFNILKFHNFTIFEYNNSISLLQNNHCISMNKNINLLKNTIKRDVKSE